MGVLFDALIKNALVVNSIGSYPAAGVNDGLAVEQDPNMVDSSIFIIEKSQVAGMGFREQVHNFTLGGLLRGITEQRDAAKLVNHLHKT